MSIILMKTLTIAVKTLARPVVTYFSYYKRIHMENSSNFLMKYLRKKLIGIGQKLNYYNQNFNRKMFRLNSDKPINPLPENKALERGIEFLAEVIIYTIIVGYPSYEIVKSGKKSALKEEKKDEQYIRMREKLDKEVKEYYKISKDLNELEMKIKELNNEIYLV